MEIKTNKIFFILEGGPTRFNVAPTFSIRDEESGLRSFIVLKIVCLRI